jgi:hypothetical protein
LSLLCKGIPFSVVLSRLKALRGLNSAEVDFALQNVSALTRIEKLYVNWSGTLDSHQYRLIERFVPQLRNFDAAFLHYDSRESQRDIGKKMQLSKMEFWRCTLLELESVNQNLDHLQELILVVRDLSGLLDGIARIASFCRNLRRVEFEFKGRSGFALDEFDLFPCVIRLFDAIPSINQIRISALLGVVGSILREAQLLLQPPSSEDDNLYIVPAKLLPTHFSILSKIMLNDLNVWEYFYIARPVPETFLDFDSLVAGFSIYQVSSLAKFTALARLCNVLGDPKISEVAPTLKIASWIFATLESLLCGEERFGLESEDIVLAVISAYGLSMTHTPADGAGTIRKRCLDLLPSFKTRDILTLLQPIYSYLHNMKCRVTMDAVMDLGVTNFALPAPEMHESELTFHICVAMLCSPKYPFVDPSVIIWTLNKFFEFSLGPKVTAAGKPDKGVTFMLQLCNNVGYVYQRSRRLSEHMVSNFTRHSKNAVLLAACVDDPDIALDIFKLVDSYEAFQREAEWCIEFLDAAKSSFDPHRVESTRRELAKLVWHRMLNELRYAESFELPAVQIDPSVAVAVKLTPTADLLPLEAMTFLSCELPMTDPDYMVYQWLHQQLEMLQFKMPQTGVGISASRAGPKPFKSTE